jgi:hypothetical protein
MQHLAMAKSDFMQFLERNAAVVASWPAWKRELFDRCDPLAIRLKKEREAQQQRRTEPMLPGKITVELNTEELKTVLGDAIKAQLKSQDIYCGTEKPVIEFEIRETADRLDRSTGAIIVGAKVTVSLGKKPKPEYWDGNK